jgi:hypothetical protein
MRVDVGDDDDRVVDPVDAQRRGQVLDEDEDRVVVAPVDRDVAQLSQRRVSAADLVEARQVGRDGQSLGCRGIPVAQLVLVLLVVDVLSDPGRATFSISS